MSDNAKNSKTKDVDFSKLVFINNFEVNGCDRLKGKVMSAYYGRGDVDDKYVKMLFVHKSDDERRDIGGLIYAIKDSIPASYSLNKEEREMLEYFINSKNHFNTLQNIVQAGIDNFDDPNFSFYKKLKDEYDHDTLNQSKMAKLRKNLAEKIDDKFGTHLEDKKLAKPIKKIEKVLKLLGKVKE